MSKAVTIAATEELFESITTYKGGVPVSVRYLYHTINDETGAVIFSRSDAVEFLAADIAADSMLAKCVADIQMHADQARAAKDIDDAAAAIAI